MTEDKENLDYAKLPRNARKQWKKEMGVSCLPLAMLLSFTGHYARTVELQPSFAVFTSKTPEDCMQLPESLGEEGGHCICVIYRAQLHTQISPGSRQSFTFLHSCTGPEIKTWVSEIYIG